MALKAMALVVLAVAVYLQDFRVSLLVLNFG
jgi:hypothetical protein